MKTAQHLYLTPSPKAQDYFMAWWELNPGLGRENSIWLTASRRPKQPPKEYFDALQQLRNAKLIASTAGYLEPVGYRPRDRDFIGITGQPFSYSNAVYGLFHPPLSRLWKRWQSAKRATANAMVRYWQTKLASIRKKHGLPKVSFWKPVIR